MNDSKKGYDWMQYAEFANLYLDHIHPITKKKLDVNSSEFKTIVKDTAKIMQRYLKKWKKNPNQYPFNNSYEDYTYDCDPTNMYLFLKPYNTYLKLYNLFYVFLHRNGDKFTLSQLHSVLPDIHLMFDGKIDMLAYLHDENLIDENERQYYVWLVDYNKEEFRPRFEKYVPFNPDYTMKQGEGDILRVYAYFYIYTLSEYMLYIIRILNNYSIHMNSYSEQIPYVTYCIDSIKFIRKFCTHYNIVEKQKMSIKQCQGLFNFIMRYHYQNYSIEYTEKLFRDLFNENTDSDIFDNAIRHLEGMKKIFNFAEDPDESPFRNLGQKPFEVIEDPLIKLLNEIGYTNDVLDEIETINVIDQSPYMNEEEYLQHHSKYTSLKTAYHSKRKRRQDNLEMLEKWKLPKSLHSAISHVMYPAVTIPQMSLPDGKAINVLTQQLPKHVKEEDILEKQRNILETYKPILDMNILQILEKANHMSSLNKDILFVNKDRDYFIKHVLHDKSNDYEKCIDNTDGISYDKFSDNYLLSRLQLMFQLRTYDDLGNIVRTDCFYAPNFYNHLVTEINDNKPVTNPVTKAKIPIESLNAVIEELMDIMRVIVPDIQIPKLIKPEYDKDLYLDIDTESIMGYTIFNLSRIFQGISFNILPICVIPSDIEPSDTGSTNISSSVFELNLKNIFDRGRLLHTYLPPYFIENQNYIKAQIHAVNYDTIESWENKSRSEQIRIFINLSEELEKETY
jgi:hypothetical protein